MLKRLRSNRSGSSYVLGIAILSIAFTPVMYFPLSYAWDQAYTVITANYTFTGVTASALTVVQFIISYMLIFGIIFTINWAVVQAKQRRYQA